MLLDLGALDSADYFADGALRTVIVTEDTDTTGLEALLWSSGFIEYQTEVASYAGASKLESARMLGNFLGTRAPIFRSSYTGIAITCLRLRRPNSGQRWRQLASLFSLPSIAT